nr:MAG TPA: hypothetical protein [Caudoviricetes sp.]
MTQLELFPTPSMEAESLGELVFCWCFRHWRTGKLIRSTTGKPFCFRARKRK